MNLRTFVIGIFIGLATVVAAVGIAFLIHVATQRGDHTRRSIAECHARGPAYHYWQDRQRCVMYVESP